MRIQLQFKVIFDFAGSSRGRNSELLDLMSLVFGDGLGPNFLVVIAANKTVITDNVRIAPFHGILRGELQLDRGWFVMVDSIRRLLIASTASCNVTASGRKTHQQS